MVKVLVVDDCRFDVEYIIRELEARKHTVIYASYGLEAQRALRKEKPHCAIYDGYLPRFEGEEISNEPEGLSLVMETQRLFPKMKCIVHSNGLDKKYLDELEIRKVPIFKKEDRNILGMLEALSLNQV